MTNSPKRLIISLDGAYDLAETAQHVTDLIRQGYNEGQDPDWHFEYDREQAQRALDLALPKERGNTDFAVGDVVRLTGATWASWEIRDDVVTVSKVGHDGMAEFEHAQYPNGFLIFADEDDDYSATLVEHDKENP